MARAPQPLTSLECELLETIAQAHASRSSERPGLADDGALDVLGDYWIEHVDEARGAFLQLQHGANGERLDLADAEAALAANATRWRAAALEAGYAERDLALSAGFLEWPIAVPADHALDGHPDIVRISPLYYRERASVGGGVDCTVYAADAITPRTTRPVAIKAMSHEGARPIIERELALISRFEHPNLPRPQGYALRPEGRAIVMGWYGGSTRSLVESAAQYGRELGLEFALSVGMQLLAALGALEALGVVHGEIRTDHLMLAADGTVTLVDFGLAHVADLPRPPGTRYDWSSPPRRGDMSYRIRYLTPEQARGLALDGRVDVFAAAGLISELVANQHPAIAANDFAVLGRIANEDLVPIRPASGLPASIAESLERGLARVREQRPTARVLGEMLTAGARRAGLDVGKHVIARTLCELGVPA